MYEHRRAPLLPRAAFLRRLARNAGFAALITAASLLIGTLGYHLLGELGWLDALVNAAMILTGMGPVDPIRTRGGKLFAASYALFSGVAFLTIIGILLAPIVHRFVHRFHLETGDGPPRGHHP